MTQTPDTAAFTLLADEAGVGPFEDRLRANVRVTIALRHLAHHAPYLLEHLEDAPPKNP